MGIELAITAPPEDYGTLGSDKSTTATPREGTTLVVPPSRTTNTGFSR